MLARLKSCNCKKYMYPYFKTVPLFKKKYKAKHILKFSVLRKTSIVFFKLTIYLLTNISSKSLTVFLLSLVFFTLTITKLSDKSVYICNKNKNLNQNHTH